jgi:hypothetical protein
MITRSFKRVLTVFLLPLICSQAYGQPSARVPQLTNTINITSFTVYAKEYRLSINWSTDGSVPTNVFEVQQSSDGQNFTTIALVLGPDPKQQGDRYTVSHLIKDKKGSLKYYFRLRHLSTEGIEQISDVVELLPELSCGHSK